MEYDTYGTANTGMTLYLKPKSTDDKIRIYDKQAEQANKQGLRIKDVAPQVRTEIEFRRQKAQDFIGQYLNQDESLLDFTRGYLKNRVHFFPIMNSRLPPENGKTSWAMSQRLNWQVLHIQTA
jgi:Replication initiation factor.